MIRPVELLLAVVIALAPIVPLPAGAQPQDERGEPDLKARFEQGNESYQKGDYDDAIEHYETLVGVGVVDEHLYYNLGNAYYKTDDLGRSVLFYERALQLSPRDNDARENLSLVRTQLRDRQFVREQNRIVGAMVWLHNHLNTREMLVFSSVCYLLTCLLGIVFVFRESALVRAVYEKASILSPGRLAGLSRTHDLLAAILVAACLFVTSGVSSYIKVHDEAIRSNAVVLDQEIPVFSSPTDDATLQFKIHEGTVVKVRQQRGQWARIGLPGGLSGWVSAQAISRI